MIKNRYESFRGKKIYILCKFFNLYFDRYFKNITDILKQKMPIDILRFSTPYTINIQNIDPCRSGIHRNGTQRMQTIT